HRATPSFPNTTRFRSGAARRSPAALPVGCAGVGLPGRRGGVAEGAAAVGGARPDARPGPRMGRGSLSGAAGGRDAPAGAPAAARSEEHTSELQSPDQL